MITKGVGKKVFLLVAVFLLVTTALFSCTIVANSEKEATMPSGSAKRITAQEAQAMMQEEGVVVLDVRTQVEFMDGHIKNAVLLPVDTLNQSTAQAALPELSTPVIVYCRSGVRSEIAASELVKLGYTQVYDLGGIQSWPYEITLPGSL